MKQLFTKNPRLVWAIAAICLSTLLFIWTNYFHQKEKDKEDTIRSAVQRNSNLAVAMEQYAIRTIHNADAILQLVSMEYERVGNRIDIDRLFFANAINKDVFRAVSILDSKGRLVNNSPGPRSERFLNVSDSNHFKHHQQQNSDKVFITPPVFSTTLKKTVIAISRRINLRDGSFGGIVIIQVEPSSFTLFYAQANLSTHDIISLISPEGITYARRTGPLESSGEDISRSPLFRHVKKNPDSFYLNEDAIRGIPTYFSYRKFEEYPMIATVGTSQKDVLADYYKRKKRDLNATIVISFLMILFSVSVSLVLLHKKRLTEKMLKEEQHHQRQLTEQVIAAQEREREVIGRELHDNVNQVLTTVKLYLEMALHKKETREELLQKSIKLTIASIDEIRKLSHELSAPTLGTRSVVDSINALIEMVASSGRLHISFDHSQYHTPISMDQKLTLYRIVQEQLNNVVKHAAASRANILLAQKENQTFLSISDNGKGFDSLEQRNGMGLNNITSRTKVFNGKVEIVSAPQKGCLVKVSLPFQANTETCL